ncbi:hypothetical protein [Nocardioides rubriscoriae]|uniref:hypothetical protein n=1 Tax=Nocardioides rubriscoriae TaxID=642762 RepID=UPI0011E00AAB|nr:hypothetical protein [Nocardioides rubriscoriae]
MTDQVPGNGSTTPRSPSRWRARLDALVPERLRARHSRGAAELSVLLVAGSLVAGVFFGQGISSTAVDVADGLTWLSDDPSGQVIQVNPATGQLEVKQVVGNPGDDLEVTAERDGQMYVADHTTGRLLAFDLTSVLVSGQRRISTGGAVDTIYNDDGVFLVDGEQSTIAAMDPVSTEAIGTIWVAPGGLADAAVDGEGTIWALEDDGTLHQLDWSPERMAFDDEEEGVVDGSADGSVLVAHDRGVTVFGPDQGLVAQVGTGHDLTADAPKVIGTIYAPERSPSDLVPVAAADNGYVVLLTPDGIVEVDMGSVSCDRPGTPEVFRGEVYVPCLGQGRVVRLGPDGRRTAQDIPTPGSDDPELILDDDNLVINAPGAPQGVVVHGDGTTSTIVREDPDLPANGLTSSATPPRNPVQGLLDDLLDLGGDDEDPSPPSSPPADPPATGGATPPGNGPGNGGGNGNGGGKPPRCGDQQGAGSLGSAPSPTAPPTGAGGGRNGGKKGGKGGCPGNGITTGGGGNGGSVGQPVTAPTDVSAEAMAEGQVRVTWRHSGIPRADGFIIRSSTGVTFPALKGWVREAFVDATPGESTSFTVTAVLGDSQATSYASNAVTTTARPGAPTVTATASYQGDNAQEVFVVDVQWSGATANGEPISSYDVAVTIPGDTRSLQVAGTQADAELTWTCSRQADADCQVGGDFQVTVVARNGLGAGAAGVFSGTAPPQPPPPLPAAGRQVVDGSSPRSDDAADDGTGSITLKLRPPSDWARFPGVCSYALDGGAAQVLACNQTSLSLGYTNGVIYEPDNGVRDHSVVFYAENARGKVASAGYGFTTKQTPQVVPGPDPNPSCPSGQICQIP